MSKCQMDMFVYNGSVQPILYNSGSQPFCARGTLIWKKKLWITDHNDEISTVFTYDLGHFKNWRHTGWEPLLYKYTNIAVTWVRALVTPGIFITHYLDKKGNLIKKNTMW